MLLEILWSEQAWKIMLFALLIKAHNNMLYGILVMIVAMKIPSNPEKK